MSTLPDRGAGRVRGRAWIGQRRPSDMASCTAARRGWMEPIRSWRTGVRPPGSEPGEYLLSLEPVYEYVSWFGDKNPSALFQVPVCVDPAEIPR